jgi:type II secretion system protein H
MRGRHTHPGFTLLELILVMAILAIVLALAAPKLTGFREGGKLRNSADEFVAATRFARTHAVSSGNVCVITLDKQNGAFVVQDQNGQNYVNVDGEFGQPISILEGGQIDGPDRIAFYPTGRVQTGQVRITASSGESVTIACGAPSEEFAIAGQ